MSSFKNRIVRAAKLDVSLYREVEADTTAFGQAMMVVILSGLAAGIGSLENGLSGAFGATLSALAGWFVWAFITYFVGTRLLPEEQTRADYGQVLRTIGFSSSPGMIRVLAIIPGIGGLIYFIASVWMLVAMVVGLREALDYQSTLRAVAVCAIGWIIQVIIVVLAAVMTGGF